MNKIGNNEKKMNDLIQIQTISQVHDFFGMGRPKHPLVSIFKIDNKLQGYGVIRKCYQGYKIGPLFADNAKIAETLDMVEILMTTKMVHCSLWDLDKRCK